MNIHEWVERNAREIPGKTCMRWKDGEITFGELARLTGALGSSLRNAGIGRGDHVTLMLPNCPEFVIAYLAVAGISAASVTVNPAYTARELEHIINDSESKALIITRAGLDTYTKISERCPLKVVITTGEGGDFEEWTRGGEPLVSEGDGGDTAAIIYSAGLTGQPMGAMLTHRNLFHQADLLYNCFGVDGDDTTLTLIPCFHAFSASVNMLSMIRYGGTMYLMPKLDFAEMYRALTEGGVTVIGGVPALFFGMAFKPELEKVDMGRLKAFISGGAALPVEVYDAFKQRFGCEIYQGYGITEAAPTCATNCGRQENRPASIGPVVPEVSVKIVDDEGRELGPHETGELLFKGPNIMKGYYNQPEATAQMLKNGWLHTGDLGHQDEDGYLYITGYKKEMVIVSGFNVYHREVEGVVSEMPGVRDCAMGGDPDLMRGTLVKVYVVRESEELSERDVKSYAREQLARYKTPRKVIFVDEIPRDAAGKVLRDELPS